MNQNKKNKNNKNNNNNNNNRKPRKDKEEAEAKEDKPAKPIRIVVPSYANIRDAAAKASVEVQSGSALESGLKSIGVRTHAHKQWDEPPKHPIAHSSRDAARYAAVNNSLADLDPEINDLIVVDAWGRSKMRIPPAKVGSVTLYGYVPLRFGGDWARAPVEPLPPGVVPHAVMLVDIYQSNNCTTPLSAQMVGDLASLTVHRTAYTIMHDLSEPFGSHVYQFSTSQIVEVDGKTAVVKQDVVWPEGLWTTAMIDGLECRIFTPDPDSPPYPPHPFDSFWMEQRCNAVRTGESGMEWLHSYYIGSFGPYRLVKHVLHPERPAKILALPKLDQRFQFVPSEYQMSIDARNLGRAIYDSLPFAKATTDLSEIQGEHAAFLSCVGLSMYDELGVNRAMAILQFKMTGGRTFTSALTTIEAALRGGGMSRVWEKYPAVLTMLTINTMVMAVLRLPDKPAMQAIDGVRRANADYEATKKRVLNPEPYKPEDETAPWYYYMGGALAVASTLLMSRSRKAHLPGAALMFPPSVSKDKTNPYLEFVSSGAFWLSPAVEEFIKIKKIPGECFAWWEFGAYITMSLPLAATFVYEGQYIAAAAVMLATTAIRIPALLFHRAHINGPGRAKTYRRRLLEHYVFNAAAPIVLGLAAVGLNWCLGAASVFDTTGICKGLHTGICAESGWWTWMLSAAVGGVKWLWDWYSMPSRKPTELIPTRMWIQSWRTSSDTGFRGLSYGVGQLIMTAQEPASIHWPQHMDWRFAESDKFDFIVGGKSLDEMCQEITMDPSLLALADPPSLHNLRKLGCDRLFASARLEDCECGGGGWDEERCVDCNARKWNHKTWVLAGTSGLLVQPANTICTLADAVISRLFKDPSCGGMASPKKEIKLNEEVWEDLRLGFAFLNQNLVSNFYEWPTAEECARAMGGQRGRAFLEAAIRTEFEAPRLRKNVQSKTNEHLCVKDPETGVKPRAITAVSTESQVDMLPFARSFAKDLKRSFNGTVCYPMVTQTGYKFGLRIIVADLGDTEFGVNMAPLDVYGSLLSESEDVVLLVSCDDAVISFGRHSRHFRTARVVGSDLGGYDQSQILAFWLHLLDLFKANGADRAFLETQFWAASAAFLARMRSEPYRDSAPRYAAPVDLLTGCPHVQMPTGGATTSDAGSTSNIAANVTCLLNDETPARYMRVLGLDYGVQEEGEDVEGVCFLKGWWHRLEDGSLSWVNLPSLVLKIGKMLRDPCQLLGEGDPAVASAAMQAAICRGVGVDFESPIVGAFCRMAERLGRAHANLAEAADSKLFLAMENRPEYKPYGRSRVNRAALLLLIEERYDISVAEVEEVERLFEEVDRLPVMIHHPVFEKLRAVDYK